MKVDNTPHSKQPFVIIIKKKWKHVIKQRIFVHQRKYVKQLAKYKAWMHRLLYNIYACIKLQQNIMHEKWIFD